MEEKTPQQIISEFHAAQGARNAWETRWQECYEYALPRQLYEAGSDTTGQARQQKLFDGTAGDAVEQLAASLLAELTPAWSHWFDLVAAPDRETGANSLLEEALQESSRLLQYHFDHSNILLALHQCFLDLVTVGTSCLLFEETPVGEKSAFRFTALPLSETVLEEGSDGRLDHCYRRAKYSGSQLKKRFPKKNMQILDSLPEQKHRFEVIETVWPDQIAGYHYRAVLVGGISGDDEDVFLARSHYEHSPLIAFRWLKAPGEHYGRSPMMKVLPDVKTANKVVELILKNASISVTGIWQADDDGVLNPATIRLVPGTIIPKAVGSGGLQPLKSPAEFNLSQLILEDLRRRIRHGLLADQLAPVDSPAMTATEVMQRTAAMTQMLGASYSRLQTELLMPLAARALSILRRRGVIGKIDSLSDAVDIQVVSPLAQKHRYRQAQAIGDWLTRIEQLGSPAVAPHVDVNRVIRHLAEIYDIPRSFVAADAIHPALPSAS